MKVLLVCDGNICRSPMAAEYLRQRAVRSGLSHLVVDSAGILGIEGAPAAAHAISAVREAGCDLTRHRSRGVTLADMRTSDLVIAMTLFQLEALSHRFAQGGQGRFLLRAFEQSPAPRGGAPELDDPVNGPLEDFQSTFAIIRTCVDHLVLYLRHAA